MSSHHPHSSIAHPGVHLYTRTDQIRADFDASYLADAQQIGLGSAADDLAATPPAPAGSYISGSDRTRSGNYMSTRPSTALPGNYTSTDATSYKVGSYLDVELTL